MEKAFTNLERVFQYTSMASEGELAPWAPDAAAAELGHHGQGPPRKGGGGSGGGVPLSRIPEKPPPGWPREGGSLEFRRVRMLLHSEPRPSCLLAPRKPEIRLLCRAVTIVHRKVASTASSPTAGTKKNSETSPPKT